MTLEVTQQSTAQAFVTTSDVTLGVAEVVEALYGRTSVTHEVMSLQYEDKDSIPPEYCEVRARLYAYVFTLLKSFCTC